MVAASSQAAALRAWGTRQNLFAEGRARITDDPQAVEAARAHPEIPLRRAVGSAAPFALEPTTLPKVPRSPKRVTAKVSPAPRAEPAALPPNRSQLDAAEAALRTVDEQRKREEARFHEEQAEIERKIAARQSAYVSARKEATATVVAARNAYRKVGGDT